METLSSDERLQATWRDLENLKNLISTDLPYIEGKLKEAELSGDPRQIMLREEAIAYKKEIERLSNEIDITPEFNPFSIDS